MNQNLQKTPAPQRDDRLTFNRRAFLRLAGTGLLAQGVFSLTGSLAWADSSPHSKPLRGIFPIAQTPFTANDKLDLDALAAEVRFLDRCGAQGLVWPQMGSEWLSLTEQERLAGMETIASAGKNLRPAIVFGVQDPDTATAVKFAKRAEKLGADAVIALPPSEQSDWETVLAYYTAIGNATELPLFIQAVGNVGVDWVIRLYEAVPTLRYVKFEAADVLKSIGPLRERSADKLKVFSGEHGRRIIQELPLGVSGNMPAAGLADLYATTWNLWQEGKHDEAAAIHNKTVDAINRIVRYGLPGVKYVLEARGIFPNSAARPFRDANFRAVARIAAGGADHFSPLDEAGKKDIAETVESLRPLLKN